MYVSEGLSISSGTAAAYARRNNGSGTHPSAHQRCSLLERHRVRQLDCIRSIRNHIFSHGPIIFESGQRGILAKAKVITTLFFQRSLAFLTSSTSVPEEQSPDAIPKLPAVDCRPYGNDGAHRLVARGHRSLRLVDTFPHLVVRVAVARGTNFEEQVVCSWLWNVDVVYFIWFIILQYPSVSKNSHEENCSQSAIHSPELCHERTTVTNLDQASCSHLRLKNWCHDV
jgi:hypothetical protein